MGLRITTNHKGFNKELANQGGVIMYGNVFGDAQYTQRIRPYTEIFCNQSTFPKGELQRCDLNHFTSLPNDVRDEVILATQDEPADLYEFRHFATQSKKVVHGYLLARNSKFHPAKPIAERIFVTNNSRKSRELMESIFEAFDKEDVPGMMVTTGNKEFDKILEETGGVYLDREGSTHLIFNKGMTPSTSPAAFYPLTIQQGKDIIAMANLEASKHLVLGIKNPFESGPHGKTKMLGAIVLSQYMKGSSYRVEGYCSTNDDAEKIMAPLYLAIGAKLETQ